MRRGLFKAFFTPSFHHSDHMKLHKQLSKGGNNGKFKI